MGLVTLTAPGTIITGTGTGAGAVSISGVATAGILDSLTRVSTSAVLAAGTDATVPIWAIDLDGTFTSGQVKMQLFWQTDHTNTNCSLTLQAPGQGGVGGISFVFVAKSALPSVVLIRARWKNGASLITIYDGTTGNIVTDGTNTANWPSSSFNGAADTTHGWGVVTVNGAPAASTVTQTFDGLALYNADLGTLSTPYTHVPTSGDSGIVFLETYPNSGASGSIAEIVGGGTATATTGDFSYTAGGTWNPPAAASITVTPTSATLGSLAGSPNSVQIVPTVRDSGGNVLTGVTVTYSSSATGVAAVSTSGLVIWQSAGSATITATAQSGSNPTATSAITCQAASVVTTVTVTPATPTVASGGTQQMTATVKDQFGVVMTSETVTWSSSNTAAGTVNSSSGLVTWIAAGTSTITATSNTDGTKSGNTVATFGAASTPTTVTVTPNPGTVPVGSTLQLSAVVDDQNGHVMTGQTITWSSSNTGVITVNSSGLATWVAAGTATITATCSPASGTTALTASTETYDFVSSAPSVCTVNALGQYNLVSHGTAVITITRHGTAISTTVNVTSN